MRECARAACRLAWGTRRKLLARAMDPDPSEHIGIAVTGDLSIGGLSACANT